MLCIIITVLFTIARTWKQLKCPSIEEWIKKTLYIYTMEHYSLIKEKEIMSFAATLMDPEIISVTEVRERQTYDIVYMQNLKYDTNELIYKTNILTGIENKLLINKGKLRREG